MKTLFDKYYKNGLEYYINKHILHLGKPTIGTALFYGALIITILIFCNA